METFLSEIKENKKPKSVKRQRKDLKQIVVEDVEIPKEEVDKKLPDEDNALLTSYMESLN
jgi:hypothetical protein